MKKEPKVLVVMSTYNGEKFMAEQIDSILAQKDVAVTIHIFDDCSKDKTQEIAREYEKKDKRVVLHVNEKNKNFTYNFIDGLFTFKNEQGYDYYAFSDQDDFWVEDKLISAINKIEEVGRCTLYSSNLKLVDGELKPLGANMVDMKYVNKKYDVACKNVVTGCTAVFDNDFKNLVTSKYPENIYLHDHWIALIANYVDGANFVYDICPDHILYRQHGNNQIGSDQSNKFILFLKYVKAKKLETVKTTRNLVERFVELFGDKISEEDKPLFERLTKTNKCKNRFHLFFKMKKNNYLSIFRIKMLLNKY